LKLNKESRLAASLNEFQLQALPDINAMYAAAVMFLFTLTRIRSVLLLQVLQTDCGSTA
jgi:hypothetical protein